MKTIDDLYEELSTLGTALFHTRHAMNRPSTTRDEYRTLEMEYRAMLQEQQGIISELNAAKN